MRPIAAVLLAMALVVRAGAAWAEGEPAPAPSPGQRAALEAAGMVGTVAYVPIKGLLCAFGVATSLPLYVSSGPKAVRAVTNRTCKGTWIITPEVLRGDESFMFVKDDPAPAPDR